MRGNSHGVSWVFVVVEHMRSQWGLTLRQALYEESLAAALALWPAMMVRHGADPGMTHVDRARQQAKEKAAAWVKQNFNVLQSPKTRKQQATRHAMPRL